MLSICVGGRLAGGADLPLWIPRSSSSQSPQVDRSTVTAWFVSIRGMLLGCLAILIYPGEEFWLPSSRLVRAEPGGPGFASGRTVDLVRGRDRVPVVDSAVCTGMVIAHRPGCCALP